jgi:ABC-2 type transport system permease protein
MSAAVSAAAVYTKYELLRTFRNRRFFLLSLAFPVVFYLLIVSLNNGAKSKHDFIRNYHLVPAQYYMVSLLSFAAMAAGLAGGARISAERQVGWNRQLRLTPLRPRMYFRTKVMTSYVMVLCSMVVLYALGLAYGVRMPAGRWVQTSWLVLVAVIPFAALGIAIGHLLTPDAMGPAMGIGTAVLAFLGGTWFPIQGGSFFVHFCQCLPSYWLTQAGHVGLGGDPWGAKGWIVTAIWSVVFAVFAMWAYRRDTRKA